MKKYIYRKEKAKTPSISVGFLIEKKRGKEWIWSMCDRTFVLILDLILYTFAERFVIMCEKVKDVMAERDSI